MFFVPNPQIFSGVPNIYIYIYRGGQNTGAAVSSPRRTYLHAHVDFLNLGTFGSMCDHDRDSIKPANSLEN